MQSLAGTGFYNISIYLKICIRDYLAIAMYKYNNDKLIRQ